MNESRLLSHTGTYAIKNPSSTRYQPTRTHPASRSQSTAKGKARLAQRVGLLFQLYILLCCILSTQAAKIPSLPNDWTYVGCLLEGEGQRMLNASEYLWGMEGMTLRMCVDHCVDQGLPMAGLENYDQCFCGTTLKYYQPVSESNCNYPCGGDKTQMCGGWAYMTLFSTTDKNPRGSGSTNSKSSSTPTALSMKTPTQAAVASATTTTTSAMPSSASAKDSTTSPVIQTVEKIVTTTAEGGSTIVTLTDGTASDQLSDTLSQSSGAASGADTTSLLDIGSGSGSILRTSSSTSIKESSQAQTLPTLGSPTQALTTGNPRLREPSQQVVFGNA
ncbi:hypothetical protein IAU59_006169 [Kwoniella sp. CBS 9459]